MARHRLPELHPEPIAPIAITGLTKGSRRPTALIVFGAGLSFSGLLPWTATVVGVGACAATLVGFPCALTEALAGTAGTAVTFVAVTFAGEATAFAVTGPVLGAVTDVTGTATGLNGEPAFAAELELAFPAG